VKTPTGEAVHQGGLAHIGGAGETNSQRRLFLKGSWLL
jgi:hypothetical protein